LTARVALLSACLLFAARGTHAAGSGPFHGPVTRAIGEVRVDGRLDEPAWPAALPIELPFEISPGENTPAPVRTICLLTFDDARLYIGFRALDPEPARIRAHVADRDSVFRNDVVGIVLDTFADGRRAFEFVVNPLGVQMDAMLSDVAGMNEDLAWDAIWSSAGRITDDGYEVEIAIPFSSLRFPRGVASQAWRVLPFRNWPRDAMHVLRAIPNDRNRSCFLCQLGAVDGLQGMVPGRNIELIPTLTVTRQDVREDVPGAPLVEGDREDELGLSARWGITPNLQLNGALNPDFSQVEADAPQLSINRLFTNFYPEKRPFFLEGADFFNGQLRVVHTRQVADPSWGAKLTGKEGRNALGAFVAHDRVTNLLFPGADGSSLVTVEGLENTTGVLRWRRDVGAGSTLGVFATSREGDGYSNRLGGVDGWVRLGRSDVVRFAALQSWTRYPEDVAAANDQPQGTFDGANGLLEYQHDSRNWSGWAGVTLREPGFRADAGFIPTVDFRSYWTGAERIIWGGPGRWFDKLRAGANIWHDERWDRSLLSEGVSGWARYDGPLQSTLRFEGEYATRAYSGTDFDIRGATLFFNIRPTGNFTTSLELGARRGIDYENVRPGTAISVEPGLTYNLGRHLYTQFDHVWEKFDEDEGWLYRVHQSALRVVYQFNVRLFARATLQRTYLRQNLAIPRAETPEAEVEDLFGQFLVSYKVNPQTVVFVGYSDGREAQGGTPRVVTERTFFAKVGYAWVM
jgi:hypothetical protein